MVKKQPRHWGCFFANNNNCWYKGTSLKIFHCKARPFGFVHLFPNYFYSYLLIFKGIKIIINKPVLFLLKGNSTLPKALLENFQMGAKKPLPLFLPPG
jgi:hypothetical protein